MPDEPPVSETGKTAKVYVTLPDTLYFRKTIMPIRIGIEELFDELGIKVEIEVDTDLKP